MNTLCIVNGTDVSEYAQLGAFDGESACDRVRRYVDALSTPAHVICKPAARTLYPDTWSSDVRESWNIAGLFDALRQAGAGYDAIVVVPGDAPFLDPELCRTMIEKHRKYFVEYSFADGFPAAVSPEILSTRILARLADLATGDTRAVGRDAIFSVVQKDINAFDVETEISAVDLRMLRITLACDTRNNFVVCKNLHDHGMLSSTASIIETIEKYGTALRGVPTYAAIQIADGFIPTVYDPFANDGRDAKTSTTMPVDRVERVIDEVLTMSPECVIAMSLYGDVVRYTAIEELIAVCAARPNASFIFETAGVGWENPDRVAQASAENISWIVVLDADDPEVYRAIRGDGYDDAIGFAEIFIDLVPERTWVQATRMKLNEEHLDGFFRRWSERYRKSVGLDPSAVGTPSHVIIQKHDHYCGRLPDRRVCDLSPVKRYPCWHVKRDVNILLDGTVVLCREDLDREHVLGNIFDDGIEAAWSGGATYHEMHVRGAYPRLCEKCDEYYTFNF